MHILIKQNKVVCTEQLHRCVKRDVQPIVGDQAGAKERPAGTMSSSQNMRWGQAEQWVCTQHSLCFCHSKAAVMPMAEILDETYVPAAAAIKFQRVEQHDNMAQHAGTHLLKLGVSMSTGRAVLMLGAAAGTKEGARPSRERSTLDLSISMALRFITSLVSLILDWMIILCSRSSWLSICSTLSPEHQS